MISTADKNPLDVHLQESSEPYVGRWNHLVSTTNWEKGRIITQWRTLLKEENASPAEFSDEAWSRLVGNVTGQHVGRLRRVYDRFGGAYEKFAGLYWSHFHAALDWEDADTWLEKAVSHSWSVSQLRRNRWEVVGGDEPEETEEVRGELDEDFEPGLKKPPRKTTDSKGKLAEAKAPEEEDSGTVKSTARAAKKNEVDDAHHGDPEEEELVRPFEGLPELPEDLAEAFEAFKLAILHHKSNQWKEISLRDILASLDALKGLVQAPSTSKPKGAGKKK